ncbi:putative trna-guanine transglycosylase [Diaporthe ampelina]|uniref:Putative trna-guanine transglycosylase n=1 Tax=Diaporthe ampelina TaxID=1214573 RepID=A0A0G2F7I0_9PEZI|nr:putative trna-guanine transglycosylase [Diaporthe ampelina]
MSEKGRAEGMRFKTLKAAGGEGLAVRLGAYMAMEDMVEKSQKKITRIPAVQKVPAADGKRLHAFTALPSSSVTILGPRRIPPVKAPVGNSDNYVQIFTSNGFQALRNPDYINAIQTLKPDVAIPLADINYGQERTPQAKSIRRMCERTEEWMSELHASVDLDELRSSNTSIFAPTLPAPYPMQWEYLNHLSDDIIDILSGLAIYDVDILPDLVNYPALTPLARLSVDSPATPHDVLRQIALGIDIFILPFINATSDAGVAMTFTFPSPTGPPNNSDAAGVTSLLPLGTDLTAPGNTTSLAPLVDSCTCYTCAHHHRAYLHHLLNAREMLAWTLLQIHNHHTVAAFFAAIRASLASATFEDDRRAFQRGYESEFPAGMGTRPRARGYHFKSEGGDEKNEKRNKPAWGRLDGGKEEKVVVVEDKLRAGGMETPLAPDANADAADLVREGFAEMDINKAQAG